MLMLLSIISQVRVYSVNDNTGEQEDQLEEILSSYQHLPPELEFYAIIYPFVWALNTCFGACA